MRPQSKRSNIEPSSAAPKASAQLRPMGAAQKRKYLVISDEDYEDTQDGQDDDSSSYGSGGGDESSDSSGPQSSGEERGAAGKAPPRKHPLQKTARKTEIPKRMKKTLDNLADKIPGEINKAAAWIQANRAPVKGMEEIRSKIAPRLPLSDHWTAADARRVEKAWKKSPNRERYLQVPKNMEVLRLYKTSLRLMRCLPDDILSEDLFLKYNDSQNRLFKVSKPNSPGVTTTKQSKIWTPGFCNELSELLLHPMWKYSCLRLATALQYTVISVTDDRRPWRTTGTPGWDPFPRLLQDASRDEQQGRPLAEIRQALAERSAREDPCLEQESDWNNLFSMIELEARRLRKKETKPSKPADGLLYVVHLKHLKVLRRALDSMSYMGYKMFTQTIEVGRGVGDRRSTKDYPLVGDFRELRDYVMIRTLEKLRGASRFSAQTQGVELGNSGFSAGLRG
ncbi:hypothetical protein B0T25DRAFT_633424 [Lasiosphaeria hispida]|uniref:Uncharacterized protein n=1 Tax=Lasiosphaeria hispida TaxID=260671 RepID=A0AAJ0HGN5_9PEZI|nr:hypothetical protein B0T25DRAFT_633424 [Lasiosphaeria hispida]